MKFLKRLIFILTIMLLFAISYYGNDSFMKIVDDSYEIVKNKYHEIVLNSSDIKKQVIDNLEKISSSGELIDNNSTSNLTDSGITGSDYEFDSTYYPYFYMLDENEKLIYKQIYANALSVSESFIPVVNVNKDSLQKSMEALYNDHPELFWLNTNYSYKYTVSGICAQVNLDYNDLINDLELNKSKMDTVADTLISNANKLNSIYEKEKYIHNSIIKLASYSTGASNHQSAYSALVLGETVCAGYARAFQYVMMKMSIPTYYVMGHANVDHAWNIVKIGDNYYNVDLTWDNQSIIIYDFFNKPDSYFNKTHTRMGLSSNLPSCN